MTIDRWLEQSLTDAERRGLGTPLKPLLEGLARATTALRAADWNLDLSGRAATPRRTNAH